MKTGEPVDGMANEETCPQCGKPMPGGGLSGLCPACLLQVGKAADSGSRPGKPAFEALPAAEVGRLFPQLEVLCLLGKGGMGAVYKARQPALDRFVALKLLPAPSDAGPDFAQRFNREARALARLSHPNIVAVHEFGQAKGQPYLIMEYVDGVNLRQLQKTGRLSPREALQVVPQICDALQYAHDEGVVHRDIKPENVLVDRKGRVKIADFGLAKVLGCEPADRTLTGVDQVVGTPHYMAPEQVERPLEVDHRADIYSLGVVFYEMLTGELPLGRFAPPSRRVQVDVRLDEVVLQALEKEPERRYQHASEVKTAVTRISGSSADGSGSGSVEPRKDPSEPPPPQRRAHLLGRPSGAILACASLVVPLGIVLWLNLAQRPPHDSSAYHSTARGLRSATPEDGGSEPEAAWRADPGQALREASSLANRGQYEESLRRHLWYHENAVKLQPPLVGVRLSFALAQWIELGRRYPAARKALVDIRDRDTRKLNDGQGYFELFMDVASINDYLQEPDETVRLFKRLHRQDAALARQCYLVAQPTLVKAGEHALCLAYLPNPSAEFERIRSNLERDQKLAATNANFARPEFQRVSQQQFVAQSCQLIWALAEAGRTSEAEGIRSQAAKVSDDARLKSMAAAKEAASATPTR